MPQILKTKAKDPTEAFFGVGIDGTPVFKVISGGPHWIICGETGSGKSVYAYMLLMSMMFHSTPDQLEITAIDPKKVEFTPFKGLPYCPIDPVTDMGDAYGLMSYYVDLMEQRYEMISQLGLKKIDEYNDWVHKNPEKAQEGGYDHMRSVVCVVDEYADMVAQEKDVEGLITRLAAKARAAGIHLMIMTQRPSATVISPTLKSNIPSRVALKTADATNSMIIIDQSGAENLRGYGDGLIKTASGIERVQGAYIPNETIAEVFEFLRQRYGEPEPFDYKTYIVEKGLADWADNYEDDVPMEKRHVVKKKVSRGGFL